MSMPGVAVPSARSDQSSAMTRARAALACGAIAGPLFIVTVMIQASSRPGFDVTRHPPSLLSLGDLGWIQITNFVLSGLLFVISAVGMRPLAKTGQLGAWGPLLIGVLGVSMVFGGVFLADPGLDFPPGAPAGRPAAMSWHAMVHFGAFAIGFASLVAACAVFARHYWGVAQGRWAAYCAGSCILLAVCFVTVMSGLTRGDLLPLYVAVVVGWVWASSVIAHLMRGLSKSTY